ncbi:uncharacterized protein C8Q71DRAFT_764447 [Rhodofomes roseus]|uniref:Uncharacterized protein n=1 Tax=Rhodofomes roseus TaxID=34475 RepID=A0ABQ8KC66_9APHY|nr:uncharacterized protein C8Q71DRAFT_764447 [Rhodofomes roseus]KAH9835168.1 hypothetical protein C8Q71DRAFT_764447 [Rhodofomes roseus]
MVMPSGTTVQCPVSEMTVNTMCDIRDLVLNFLELNEHEANMHDYVQDAGCIALDCAALGVGIEGDDLESALATGGGTDAEGDVSEAVPSAVATLPSSADREEGEISDDEDVKLVPVAASSHWSGNVRVVANDTSTKSPGFAYHTKQNNKVVLNVPNPEYAITVAGPKAQAASNPSSDRPKRNRAGKASLTRYRQHIQQERKKTQRHMAQLQSRVSTSGTTAAITSFDIKTDVNITSTGWQGRNVPEWSRNDITARWRDGSIRDEVAKFLPLAYIGDGPASTLKVVDIHGRLFLYRGFPAPFLNAEAFVHIHNMLLSNALLDPKEKEKAAKGHRGPHLPRIIGHYRQSSPRVTLTNWHKNNKELVDGLLEDELFIRLNKFIESTVEAVFPAIFQRFKKSAEWHAENTGFYPLFGGFWDFCLNGIFPNQPRVHCMPHSDAKNPVGICVLMVYVLPNSKFNSKHRSWLVIWEAGIVIEVPPWTPVIYPSSLFLHFNIDVHDIEFVHTDGSVPEKDKHNVIEGDECGRGSAVWFNMATMLQTSETGHATLKQAKDARVSTTTDYAVDVEKFFPNNVEAS